MEKIYSFIKKTYLACIRISRIFWYLYVLNRIFKVLRVNTSQGVYRVYTKDKVIGMITFSSKQVYGQHFMDDVYSLLKKEYPHFDNAEGVTLYNIGANIGCTCISAISENRVSNVIAIEAESANYQLLKENIALNKFTNKIHSIHCAVSDRKDTIALYRNNSNLGDHRVGNNTSVNSNQFDKRVSHVPSDSLKAIIKNLPTTVKLQKNALVWIDVQGYEGYVLKGAQDWFKALDEDNLVCVCEVSPSMIKDSGMAIKAMKKDFSKKAEVNFIDICTSMWKYYYIYNGESRAFVKYPIANFSNYVESMIEHDYFSDIIFTRK